MTKWFHPCMHGSMDACMYGLMHEWMGGWMDGLMDGWIDGWMADRDSCCLYYGLFVGVGGEWMDVYIWMNY